MANPRRRRIRKISLRAAAVAQAAGNEKALEVALAIAAGCREIKEAEAELARVKTLCAPKSKAPVPAEEPKPKLKVKAKPKGLGSKLKKAISKD